MRPKQSTAFFRHIFLTGEWCKFPFPVHPDIYSSILMTPPPRMRSNAAISARIDRALVSGNRKDRLYLVDAGEVQRSADGWPKRSFRIQGSTGNVYVVSVARRPGCTCIDHRINGHTCKHILFVMLRVYDIPRTNDVVWQSQLGREELEGVLGREFGRRPRDRRKVDGGDCCPICYEEMHATGHGTDDLVRLKWCGACGNNVHEACFSRWMADCLRRGADPTCVVCRAQWSEGDDGDLLLATGMQRLRV
jgi:hypothetical protein